MLICETCKTKPNTECLTCGYPVLFAPGVDNNCPHCHGKGGVIQRFKTFNIYLCGAGGCNLPWLVKKEVADGGTDDTLQEVS